ncbi:MAG: hypothetical protein P4K93_11020 [Terracidiphilus sp.]|nr:hypothetical protein [Terracidiphilus sp.]MDR3798679.1 hypothetical protein [Terracidiphilus sp.]
MIETPTYSLQPALLQTELSVGTNSTIFKSVRVNADAHRISRALTVPEYLEAWISIPGAAPGSVTLASSEDNGYRLDHYCASCPAFRISGSFVFCHLRKMRLFWRKTSNDKCVVSVVDFRLRGDFGSSVVELRHIALATADERVWHEAFWGRSLEKLALLFGS